MERSFNLTSIPSYCPSTVISPATLSLCNSLHKVNPILFKKKVLYKREFLFDNYTEDTNDVLKSILGSSMINVRAAEISVGSTKYNTQLAFYIEVKLISQDGKHIGYYLDFTHLLYIILRHTSNRQLIEIINVIVKNTCTTYFKGICIYEYLSRNYGILNFFDQENIVQQLAIYIEETEKPIILAIPLDSYYLDTLKLMFTNLLQLL